jgi:hypothetical protein
MKQILKLVFLLVIGQTAFAQAPSNYTNINGRYRWIAGMFDSTFHIPKGSTPSLRTGGSTNSGGLFYNTSDSSVYTYTGTQWIKLRGSINPSDTTNKYVTQVYKKSGSDSIFYVKGGVHTWAFNDSTGSPGGGGGGKVYYFNGGVDMGTIGGLQMYELGDTANTGAAANFTRSTTGNIANFITDPGKPGLLEIPAGVWSVDAWLSETGGGANHAEIWVEVEKWDGSTITTIATSPIEQITEGATPNLYSWSVTIPTTTLAITDRIVIQFYISNTNGKTVTLYTQNGYVGEVHTTFTTGIGAINGLTAPAQYLVTGTSGTDFNINSSTATHTFNLPTASATNRGALSTTDWSTFNNKIGGSLVSGYLTKATGTNTIDTSQIFQSSGRIGVSTTSPQTRLMVAETASDGALSILGNSSNVGTFKFYANNGSTIQSVVNSSSSAMQIGTFVNSEMNLITNSATRVSILNNGNVGIGSGAATDSMLTVENGARFKRGVRMSGLPTGVGTKALRINASGTLSIADTLANGISGTGTTNYIPKFTSSSAIGNSQIFDNGTSVGIGTIAPAAAAKLELIGDYRQKALAANSNGFNISINSSTDIVSLTNFYNAAITFGTNNTEQMRLTSTGLGIGTSSPNTKLEISGEANPIFRITSTSGPYSQIQSNTAGTLQLMADEGNTGASTSMRFRIDGAEAMRLDASGNLGLSVAPSAWGSTFKSFDESAGNLASFSTSELYLTQGGYNNSGWKYTATGFASQYLQVNGQHRWNIAASGTAGNAISFTQAMTLDASGNLGIGITSPNSKLEIYNGSGDTRARITSTGASGASDIMLKNASGTSPYEWLLQGLGANGRFRIYDGVAGQERFTITSGGSVGIGTSSPAYRLDVQTTGQTVLNIRAANNNTADIFFSDPDADNRGVIRYSHTSDFMSFWSAGAEAMRISSGGYLALGTTNGYGQFTIGNITNNLGGINFENASDASSRRWQLRNDVVAFGDFSIRQSTTQTGTTFSDRLYISSGGNVGIGTSSPSYLLHLYSSSGTTLGVQDAGTAFRILNNSGTNYIQSGTAFSLGSAAPLAFSNMFGGTEWARFNTSGEFLINTTSDAGDYKLQVNGNGYINGKLTIADVNAVIQTGNAVTGSIWFQNTNSGGTTYIGRESSTSSAFGATAYATVLYSTGNYPMEFFTNSTKALTLTSAQNAEFAGSIKTAAPSGGTAKPWKLGEAGVSVGGANTTAVKVEIDGVVYYLLTAYLPEPEPDPAALPSSGPSASYKTYNKPIPVKTTKDVEIDNLKKEIEELKQLIKNK